MLVGWSQNGLVRDLLLFAQTIERFEVSRRLHLVQQGSPRDVASTDQTLESGVGSAAGLADRLLQKSAEPISPDRCKCTAWRLHPSEFQVS